MFAIFFSNPVQILMSLELLEDPVPPPVDVKLNAVANFKLPGMVLTEMLRDTTR
jgi:hypothetical protein